MASYGPLKQSFGMLHPAANRHPKATHQWLLMGVQACRLPALKPTHQWLLMGRLNNPLACSSCSQTLQTLKNLKTLKTLTWHASSCSQQPPRGHTSMASYGPLKQSLGMLHPAANRHPKATHQSLLMGVQACRLPALKPSKPSKPLKTLKNLKTLKTLTWHASSCSQQPPRGHTSMASYGPLKQSLGSYGHPMLHPAAA